METAFLPHDSFDESGVETIMARRGRNDGIETMVPPVLESPIREEREGNEQREFSEMLQPGQ